MFAQTIQLFIWVQTLASPILSIDYRKVHHAKLMALRDLRAMQFGCRPLPHTKPSCTLLDSTLDQDHPQLAMRNRSRDILTGDGHKSSIRHVQAHNECTSSLPAY
jgi:hypothetical protein